MRMLIALALASLCGPAFCADKEESLANCEWEVERTMVLYRAIYEGGYKGKLEADAFQELYEKILRTPENSKDYQSLKKMEKQNVDREVDREEDIQNKLMDRCMRARGYRFNWTEKATCAGFKHRSDIEAMLDCWVGK
jgi:hypothetical protein